jgi:hypothetical protein
MNRRSPQSPLSSRLRTEQPKSRRGKTATKRRTTKPLVGRDLAPLHRAEERRRRLLPVLLIGCLLATLGLTALRIDLIRQRYALAAAMREEKRLLEEQRTLTAQVRSLRDPARLAVLAAELGFERPAGVIQLPEAGLPGRGVVGSDVALGPRP